MLLKRIFFAWARYYEKNDDKPSWFAFVEASFAFLVPIVLIIFPLYHYLIYAFDIAPVLPDPKTSDNSASSKLKFLPYTLLLITVLSPLFYYLYKATVRELPELMKIPKAQLYKYRMWHVLFTIFCFVLMAVSLFLIYSP